MAVDQASPEFNFDIFHVIKSADEISRGSTVSVSWPLRLKITMSSPWTSYRQKTR